MNTQNLDKLPDDAKALIAWSFEHLYDLGGLIPFPPYMIEVKIDDPLAHLLEGGEMTSHRGNGSKCYQKHNGDDEWAIVHNEDRDWQQYSTDEWINRGREVLRRFMPDVVTWEAENSPRYKP